MKLFTIVLLGGFALLLSVGCQQESPLAPTDQVSATNPASFPELQKPAPASPVIKSLGNGYITITIGHIGGAATYSTSFSRYPAATGDADYTSGTFSWDRVKEVTIYSSNIVTGSYYSVTQIAYNSKGVVLATTTSDRVQ